MKILITESQIKILVENSLYDKFGEAMKSKGWSDEVVRISKFNTKEDIYEGLGDLRSKYESWILKSLTDYVKERGDTEIVFDLIELVKEFEQKQNRFTTQNVLSTISPTDNLTQEEIEKIKVAPKDINSYSPKLLSHILENLPESKKEKSKSISKEAEKIYEDNNILVLRPMTRNASCKYGANTKWCTAGRLDNRFSQHFDDGLLVYYIIKPNVKLPDEKYRKMASFQSIDNQYNYIWYDSEDNVMEMSPTSIFFKSSKEFKDSLRNAIQILEKKFRSNFTDYEGWEEYEWSPGEGWVEKPENS